MYSSYSLANPSFEGVAHWTLYCRWAIRAKLRTLHFDAHTLATSASAEETAIDDWHDFCQSHGCCDGYKTCCDGKNPKYSFHVQVLLQGWLWVAGIVDARAFIRSPGERAMRMHLRIVNGAVNKPKLLDMLTKNVAAPRHNLFAICVKKFCKEVMPSLLARKSI